MRMNLPGQVPARARAGCATDVATRTSGIAGSPSARARAAPSLGYIEGDALELRVAIRHRGGRQEPVRRAPSSDARR